MNMMKFIKTEPVTKGWSCDKKYRVTKADGTEYLLRVSPVGQYERKKAMFEMTKRVASLGVPMCVPVEFGVCEDGVYALQTWIDGKDAQEVIPLLSDTQQYIFGLEAGRILKKIHSIPAPKGQEDWEIRLNRKLDRKVKAYRECPIKFKGSEAMEEYISENRHLLRSRPQCYQHGDYHIGNMMLSGGKLYIIDFDRDDFGDPWEEFNRIVWCAQMSPLFASGMVNGYFDGNIPIEFWKLLVLYISGNMLSSFPWALPFGEEEVETMRRQAKEVLAWYDDMKTVIPKWYSEGFCIQYINGMPCKLKSPFDFGFLDRYGKVFKIFDDQDSGNICFGTEKDGKRYFIKFAGAPAERYNGDIRTAVDRLKNAVRVYTDLAHPCLIKLIKAEEIGGGFAAVFEWADGDCMGRMYPESHRAFMALPVEERLKAFDDILSFHEYVNGCGYVAVDFYDGSIMYDFKNHKTIICDIDYYVKKPYINPIGRMWGSSRFMSPEEFIKGEAIDEVTNVYTMGATAFALFADYKRDAAGWTLSANKYSAAVKAVSGNRSERQNSIKQFTEEWRTTD
ncbi:MAG: phosphotransferase [Eubacteriales bacterium]|nr:phosphotransferase [Eubacteriales bacterium]